MIFQACATVFIQINNLFFYLICFVFLRDFLGAFQAFKEKKIYIYTEDIYV